MGQRCGCSIRVKQQQQQQRVYTLCVPYTPYVLYCRDVDVDVVCDVVDVQHDVVYDVVYDVQHDVVHDVVQHSLWCSRRTVDADCDAVLLQLLLWCRLPAVAVVVVVVVVAAAVVLH